MPAVFCHPAGIRVWRGFRSRTYLHKRREFEQVLGNIFVPHTAQQMIPLGLQSYFPAILPDMHDCRIEDEELRIPDEVALVVYADAASYRRASRESVAGRAYGALHGPFFHTPEPTLIPQESIPISRSSHPEPWQLDWQWDTPYYLKDNAIDWWEGSTWLLAAQPASSLEREEFGELVTDLVAGWLQSSHESIDGSVLCISRDYLLYWEHRTREADEHESLIPVLQPVLESPWMCRKAETVMVPPAFRQADSGIDFASGDLLDVRMDCRQSSTADDSTSA